VNTDALKNEWDYINNFHKVRNCIVHCGGNIKSSKDAKDLQDIVINNKGLSIAYEDRITLSRKYIDCCITETEQFLDKLYQQVFEGQSLQAR